MTLTDPVINIKDLEAIAARLKDLSVLASMVCEDLMRLTAKQDLRVCWTCGKTFDANAICLSPYSMGGKFCDLNCNKNYKGRRKVTEW